MATCILQEFKLKFSIFFYDVDTKLVEALKLAIEKKEKEQMSTTEIESPQSKESSKLSPTSIKQELLTQKIEFQTEEKVKAKAFGIDTKNFQRRPTSPHIRFVEKCNDLSTVDPDQLPIHPLKQMRT